MDVIIVGTGVAAILLAQALVRRNVVSRLCMVGRRRPLAPHVLSYWSDTATPFDVETLAAWSRVQLIEAGGETIDIGLERLTYRTIRAQAWATRAMAELADRVEHIDADVDRVHDDDGQAGVWVDGQLLEADWVFASHARVAEPDCHQRFLGWELEVPDGMHDVVAPRLLDFRTPAEHDFRFVYVLPLGPSRLFIEHVSYAPCNHAAELAGYLRDVLSISSWELIDQEGGATPIFAKPPTRGVGRVLYIGVGAGLAKAATGYALTRMWRDAEHIADALEARREPARAHGRASLYDLADRYFVDLLQHAPERLPELLAALFRRAPGDAVLGFLDERASLGERLAVGRAVPGWAAWLFGRS